MPPKRRKLNLRAVDADPISLLAPPADTNGVRHLFAVAGLQLDDAAQRLGVPRVVVMAWASKAWPLSPVIAHALYGITVAHVQATTPRRQSKRDIRASMDSYAVARSAWEQQLLRTRIAECGGDLQRARKSLRLSQSTFYRRLRALNIARNNAHRPRTEPHTDDDSATLAEATESWQREYFIRRLALVGGNLSALAKSLGISKSNAYLRAEMYGLLQKTGKRRRLVLPLR